MSNDGTPPLRIYLILLLLYLAVTLAGSVVGAVHDGAGSIVPNFLRYGLGYGSGVAVLLACAYFLDRRRR